MDCEQLPEQEMVGKHEASVVAPCWQEVSLWLLVEDLAANGDKVVAQPVQIVETPFEGESWLVRPELLCHRLRIS